MQTLSSERKRALTAIDFEFSHLSDAELDDWARAIIGLPSRPEGAEPFLGWLLPEKKPQVAASTKKNISAKGIELIKQWEGWRAKAYICPAGVWTIGYGHTKTARRGMKITVKQGEHLLRQDLQTYVNCVNRVVKVPLNQNQFDALVSFTYNLGCGGFSQSSLLRWLNQGDYEKAATWFDRYVYGGGVKLPGLIARRQSEKELFKS